MRLLILLGVVGFAIAAPSALSVYIDKSYHESSHESSHESYPKSSQESYPKSSQESYPKSSQERYHQSSHESYPKSSQESYPKSSKESYHKGSHESSYESSHENYPKSSQESYPKSSKESYYKSSHESSYESSHENYPKSSQESYPKSSHESSQESYHDSSLKSYSPEENIYKLAYNDFKNHYDTSTEDYGGYLSDGYYDKSEESAEITRNVYVFASPRKQLIYEPDPIVPKPKIHHNIIFVKTPEIVQSNKPIEVTPPQTKTILYVLSKNAYHGQRTVEFLDEPQETPEVYFVHYNHGENPILPDGKDLHSALSLAHLNVGTYV